MFSLNLWYRKVMNLKSKVYFIFLLYDILKHLETPRLNLLDYLNHFGKYNNPLKKNM